MMNRLFAFSCALLLFSAPIVTGQTYLHQLVPLASGVGYGAVALAGDNGGNPFFVDQSTITQLDGHSGSVAACNQMLKFLATISITSAVRNGNTIFLCGTAQDSSVNTGFVMTYNLALNSPQSQLLYYFGSQTLVFREIVRDSHSNLYVLGSVLDTSSGLDQMIIVRMDSNYSLSWIKRISHSYYSLNPQNLLVASDSVLYVTGITFDGVKGIPFTMVMDSSGNTLRSRAQVTSTGFRFAGSRAAILNDDLIVVYSTLIGPSDVGPLLIQRRDRMLDTLATKSVFGFAPGSIGCNDRECTISGTAPITYGYRGFRSIRINSSLRIKGGNYFNSIGSGIMSTATYSYLNPEGLSYHYFHENGYDQVYAAKTDTAEMVGCGDTAFAASPASFQPRDTTFPLTNTSISLRAKSFTAYTYAQPVLTHSTCEPSSVDQLAAESFEWSIFPNPVADIAHLNYKTSEPCKIQITDLAGCVVVLPETGHDINVSQLQPGIYLLRITDKNGMRVRKFIKN